MGRPTVLSRLGLEPGDLDAGRLREELREPAGVEAELAAVAAALACRLLRR